jgi:hypothetical protein
MLLALLTTVATIQLTSGGPDPAAVTVTAPAEVVWRNATDHDVTVRTAPFVETIKPGDVFGYRFDPGQYRYTADGANGTVSVLASARAPIHPSARVAHGGPIVLSGTITGKIPDTLGLWALRDGGNPFVVAYVHPDAEGRWRVVVRPPRTTQYSLQSAYVTSPWVTVSVRGLFTVRVRGRRVTFTLTPSPQIGKLPILVGARTILTGARGTATARFHPGRYKAWIDLGPPFGEQTRAFTVR